MRFETNTSKSGSAATTLQAPRQPAAGNMVSSGKILCGLPKASREMSQQMGTNYTQLSLSLYAEDLQILHDLASALRDAGLRFNRSLAYRAALQIFEEEGLNRDQLRKAYERSEERREGDTRKRVCLAGYPDDTVRTKRIGDAILKLDPPTIDDAVVARTVLRYVAKPSRAFVQVAKHLAETAAA